jgi:ABC-type nickel/cobalt efflux system permease component RcnA
MHFISGLIIAIALSPIIGFYAVTAVAIIALVKEVYDYCNADKHTADLWDWIVTVLGGLVGFVIIALI